MSSAAALHHSLVRLQAGRVHLVQGEEDEREDPRRPEEDVTKAAVPMLMLACYRNQCLHVFVRPALLAVAIHVTKSVQRGEGNATGLSNNTTWHFITRFPSCLLLIQTSSSPSFASCGTSSPTNSSPSPGSRLR